MDPFRGYLGYNIERDEAKGIELIQKAAAQNNPMAIRTLAMLYMEGTEKTPRDPKKAIELMKQAADLGNPESQFILAAMFFQGQNNHITQDQAIKYLEQAAQQHHPQALYAMGCYYRGDMDKNIKSDVKSLEYFEKANKMHVSGTQLFDC